jgi:hypothetical protein
MSKATTTTDHDEIRQWADERGGRPSVVRTGEGRGGILRFDFGEDDEKLEETSWEEFFKIFDDNHLAFLHQDQVGSGQTSRFFKFVSGDAGSSRKAVPGRKVSRRARASSDAPQNRRAIPSSSKAAAKDRGNAATKGAAKAGDRRRKTAASKSSSARKSASGGTSSKTRSQPSKGAGSRTSKTPRGRTQDRARVAGGQRYEVAYEAKKSGKSKRSVKRAVKKVGSSRKKVERELRR